MSKPHKLSLKSIVAQSVAASVPAEPGPAALRSVGGSMGAPCRGTLKERAKQLSVYLEPPVHDQLRDLAYTERTKIHALMLEAVDLLFKQRGARSIEQLLSREAK